MAQHLSKHLFRHRYRGELKHQPPGVAKQPHPEVVGRLPMKMVQMGRWFDREQACHSEPEARNLGRTAIDPACHGRPQLPQTLHSVQGDNGHSFSCIRVPVATGMDDSGADGSPPCPDEGHGATAD